MPDDWTPTRSFAGTSGYALTFMALATSTGESRYEAAMHAFIRTAARLEDRPHLGLFGGISGLRAVTALAARLEPRYAGLVAQCDRYIESNVPQPFVLPASFGEFDVIGGWAGIRLARCIDGPREADVSTHALAWILDDEWRWCCVHPVRGGAPENDLGLAHGAPGMLAAMALTLDDPARAHETLARAAREIASHAYERDGITWWPYGVGATDPPRAAWCYGIPGVASALYAAGRALRDDALAAFGVRALEGLERVADADSMIDEANICHGRIGNALTVASVACTAGSAALQRVVERYVVAGLDELEATGGRCMSRQDDGAKHDTYNELTGSAGIVLALLTLAGEFDGAWMRGHALNPIS